MRSTYDMTDIHARQGYVQKRLMTGDPKYYGSVRALMLLLGALGVRTVKRRRKMDEAYDPRIHVR